MGQQIDLNKMNLEGSNSNYESLSRMQNTMATNQVLKTLFPREDPLVVPALNEENFHHNKNFGAEKGLNI
jgi:hypothetical protein